MVEAGQQLDMRELGRLLRAPGLGLASAERLHRYLRLNPGAVSLPALVNDPDHSAELLMDRKLSHSDYFQSHPLVNTTTLILDWRNLQRVLAATRHTLQAIEMPPGPVPRAS